MVNQGEATDSLEARKIMGEPLNLLLDETVNLGVLGEFTIVFSINTDAALLYPMPQRPEIGHDEGTHGAPVLA